MLVAVLSLAYSLLTRMVLSQRAGWQLADVSHFEIKLRDLVRIRCQMRRLGLHDPKQNLPLPAFECRPDLVNTACPDEKGCLVLADVRLVTVLVRAGDSVEQDRERLSNWHMDAGFGCCAVPVPPLFGTLADAVAWICTRLKQEGKRWKSRTRMRKHNAL